MVFHDITPMNVRLHKISLLYTDNCTQCGRQDTVLHRLTECGVRKEIWECICTRIARIRRTDPSCIPTEWLLRPGFQLWPRRRHKAILWFLGNKIFYLVQRRRTLSAINYIDFPRRTRRKTYQDTNRMKIVWNCLEVF